MKLLCAANNFMVLEIYMLTGFGDGRVRSSTLTGIYYAILTAVVRSTPIVKI